MESEKELQPCPFCGSADLIKKWHFVTCKRCGMDGPIKGNEQEAIKAWNGRTIPLAKAQSRISTLEAALSLDDERIEKIASEMYGVPIDRAPSAIARMYRSHASTAIKELRKLAGMEVPDGN